MMTAINCPQRLGVLLAMLFPLCVVLHLYPADQMPLLSMPVFEQPTHTKASAMWVLVLRRNIATHARLGSTTVIAARRPRTRSTLWRSLSTISSRVIDRMIARGEAALGSQRS